MARPLTRRVCRNSSRRQLPVVSITTRIRDSRRCISRLGVWQALGYYVARIESNCTDTYEHEVLGTMYGLTEKVSKTVDGTITEKQEVLNRAKVAAAPKRGVKRDAVDSEEKEKAKKAKEDAKLRQKILPRPTLLSK